jgi:hypothetical protein
LYKLIKSDRLDYKKLFGNTTTTAQPYWVLIVMHCAGIISFISPLSSMMRLVMLSSLFY